MKSGMGQRTQVGNNNLNIALLKKNNLKDKSNRNPNSKSETS